MRPSFDHEKFDVYQLELRFIGWVAPLLATVKQTGATIRTAEVIDQLDRASLSALLNTAEGNGRRQAQARARFFDDSCGSATECTACLDALVAKTLCSVEEVNEGKMLLRIVSMLTKLVARFDSSSSSIIREEADGERTRDEDEEENEKGGP